MSDKMTMDQLIEVLILNKEKWEFDSFQRDLVWPSIDECGGRDPMSFPAKYEVTLKLHYVHPEHRFLDFAFTDACA